MLKFQQRILIVFFSLVLSLSVHAQKIRPDNFIPLIDGIRERVHGQAGANVVLPTNNELHDMGVALQMFRAKLYDSCKTILSKHNYTLTQIFDGTTASAYDVFREKTPIRKGWGTFIYNRNHKKRLYIHVNHPVDDPQADIIGAELFRKSGAEWLFIAGTPRLENAPNIPSDIGKAKQTVFQRWHELLTDLTHVTISLHGYRSGAYHYPIKESDIVISNGKTTDDQLGISQISLSFRDSLRMAGFKCSLAMYDSGFAALSGRWNVQGVFSNDSVGFGHWLYVELSERVRDNPAAYNEFINATSCALDLTGKKVSRQMNLAWGLVSPRVVKVDSLHRIMFPPANTETYRILSFNTNNLREDTLDIRLGNWLDVMGSSKSVTRVTRIDSMKSSFADRFRGQKEKLAGRVLSQVVKESPNEIPHKIRHAKDALTDSSLVDDEQDPSNEPLQVHRIPLRPVLASTISNEYTSNVVPFRWEGIVYNHVTPNIITFEMNNSGSSSDELQGLPNFLIPIINRSYHNGRSRFIGVQMTRMLIDEIARLVNEHKDVKNDVGLIAEELQGGDYYLRIFPTAQKKQLALLRQ